MRSLLLFLLLFSCNTFKPKTISEFQETAVLIDSPSGTGGSGVIYKSSDKGTVILTNKHVCQSVVSGGTVYRRNPYKIVSYKLSNLHDMCLIRIKENLDINTVVSDEAPERNSKVYISGHPSLYPHIVSEGYVSGIEHFRIQIDKRECGSFEKLMNPLECIFYGFPITEYYESQVVSALISPGSSGSGVFNDKGELVGLAFASKGDIDYALVVPWLYLNKFVTVEYKELKWVKVDSNKHVTKYKNNGIYDIENWKEVYKLIKESDKCLKPLP